jgi:type I restriction enzyme, R subunit
MKKALKDYAQGQEGLDDPPVREKEELFKLLDEAIDQGLAFCLDKDRPARHSDGAQGVSQHQ